MRDDPTDIQALMTRLAEGDRSAFEPLYEALWPTVLRLATRMLVGAPEAEDAAQEAMMKVLARAALFDPSRDARAWVLGVTAYECRSLRQKRKRRREDSSDHGAEVAATESPEDAVIARDLEQAASEVLGELRAVDLETLRAVLAGERPDVPQATFRKRVERALTRLREAWSGRHDD